MTSQQYTLLKVCDCVLSFSSYLTHCAVLLDHVWATEAMEGGTVGKGVGCGTGMHSMLLLREEVMNKEKPVLGLRKPERQTARVFWL